MTFKKSHGWGAAALALAWFLSPTHAEAATACATSPANLRGWYAMLIAGGNVPSGTAKYQVGAMLFDGSANLYAPHVYSSGGVASTALGTYQQNSDCTLTITMTVGTTASTYTVAVKNTGEAVGIEVDANSVATISLKPQFSTYVPAANYNNNSLNGSYAASCVGPLSASTDTNLMSFQGGALTGTDPYNTYGTFTVANFPFTATYTVNSDGTFIGSVQGAPFNFYGVIGANNKEIEYIYTNVANNASTDAFTACVGGVAPTLSTAVNLLPSFNVNALYLNGSSPAGGGIDAAGYAYPANLLGSSVTWNGLVFPMGPANAANAVANTTIALPAGNFSSLNLLGTATNSPQTGTLVVTYTDGTTQSFTQNFSDWGAPNGNSNESVAAATAYRVAPGGAIGMGPWYVYGYSFALNNSKTVASVTLPATQNVSFLSAVLKN